MRFRSIWAWGTMAILLAMPIQVRGQTPVGTAFTYQGHLLDNSVPASGPYDLRFVLYDSTSSPPPTPLGTVYVDDLQVAQGLFTVPSLDFGSAFDGNRRWLELAVRPGSVDNGNRDPGSYMALTPLQEVTPAPYALFALNGPSGQGDFWALTGNAGTTPGTDFLGTTDNQALEIKVNGARALRIEPNTYGPNIIGGSSYNSVSAGAYASTIAGGDTNHVYDQWGSVGGGSNNQTGSDDGNTATAPGATVAGGLANKATSSLATVAGGGNNEASGIYAAVGGGNYNTASGAGSVVPGGLSCTAGGSYSLAAGCKAKVRDPAATGDGDGDEGTFVWADSNFADFTSTGPNQFLIRAGGGVGVNTNSPSSPLTVNGIIQSLAGGFKFPDGTVQTTAATGGGGSWSLTGNAGTTPGTNFLGTTDNQALQIKVNSNRALRIEPAATSPNIIGGHSDNTVASGVSGATIAGGGAAGTEYDLNKVTDDFGTVGGGRWNRAGDDDADHTNAMYATVPGGRSCHADAKYSFAAGRLAKVRSPAAVGDANGDQGTFLWADSTALEFVSVAANEFAARCTGGARFVTAIDGSGNPTKGLRLSPAGYLGLGTWTPSVNLDIYSTLSGNEQVSINSTATDFTGINLGNQSGQYYQRYAFRTLGTAAAGREGNLEIWGTTLNPMTVYNVLTATPSGKVGIGTQWPTAKLTIGGTSGVDGIKFPDGTLQTTAAWGLTGNAGTTPGTNFLGTTDNQALEIKVNGARSLRIEPASTPNIIGGSSANSVSGGAIGSMIAGGGSNHVYDNWSSVGGGYNNRAGSDDGNTSSAPYATVGGGQGNKASSWSATVAGGQANEASGLEAAVGGGGSNTASGQYSMAPGGLLCTAGGSFSFAAGRSAKVRDPAASGDSNGDEGTFVWADSNVANFTSSGPNQFLIRASGGVGVNRNNPAADLDVAGDALFSGNVAIGTNDPEGNGLRVYGNVESSGGVSGIFQVSGPVSCGWPCGDGTSRMVFDGNDINVVNDCCTGSIGGGALYLNNNSDGQVSIAQGGGNVYLASSGDSSYDQGDVYIAANAWNRGGKVMIGYTTMDDLLNVGGVIRSASGGFRFPDDTIQTTAAMAGGGYWTSSGSHINNNNAGNVGIGRQALGNKLEVEGDASKTTAGTWSANSDARIKTDIQTITGALDSLDRVRLVSFRYNDEYRQAHPSIQNRRYINIIAQEFAEVFPDYVKPSGERLPQGGEILQADPYPLTIYAAAGVQELHQIVQEKDAKIAALNDKIDSMTKQNDKLQARLAALEAAVAKLAKNANRGAR